MTKTMRIIAQNAILFIVACLAIMWHIDGREVQQARVQQQVQQEKQQVRAELTESLKIQLKGLKETGCSSKASYEATSVVVIGAKSTGPVYFADTLYYIPPSKFMVMKQGEVWALLWCD